MTTLKLNLSVKLYKDEGEEDYSSICHEIGVASLGETPAEAEAYLKEAVELTLEDMSLSDLKYRITEYDAEVLDECGVPYPHKAEVIKARQKIVQDIDKAMLAEKQSLDGKHPQTTFKLNYAPALVCSPAMEKQPPNDTLDVTAPSHEERTLPSKTVNEIIKYSGIPRSEFEVQ